MMKTPKHHFFIYSVVLFCLFSQCKPTDLINKKDPDIMALKEGFKTSSALGYCASVAATVLRGDTPPPNVTFTGDIKEGFSNSGLIHIDINDDFPLPFNSGIGDIFIAGIWGEDNSGVLSVIFADIDLLEGRSKFYGLHTIPVATDEETGNIITAFGRQDIVMGEGSDTLLVLNMSNPQFNLETDRARESQPRDAFVAISQNIWFVNIDQQGTPSVYDDLYVVNGGGQLVGSNSEEAGVQYHAMVGAEMIYDRCIENPIEGFGLIQNFQAEDSSVDLGNIYMKFHGKCDGQAYVEVGTGEYFRYLQQEVNLNFN